MPEAGDLLRGFLYRTQEYEREEEAEEEKKRRKLEDQLKELNLSALQRRMERERREYEYQQRKRSEVDELMKQLTSEELKKYLFGISPPEPEEPPYPWMGTPYEKAGARKEFYIKPEERGGVGMATMPWAKGWGINPQTGQWEYRPPTDLDQLLLGGELPAISELMPPSEEEPTAPPEETAPPLMMGGREFSKEIPLESITPSLFSPEFEQQKKEQTLAEVLKGFQPFQVPVDFEKTEIALKRLREIPKEQALADLEENRTQHRSAGLDVDYLIRRIKGGK